MTKIGVLTLKETFYSSKGFLEDSSEHPSTPLYLRSARIPYFHPCIYWLHNLHQQLIFYACLLKVHHITSLQHSTKSFLRGISSSFFAKHLYCNCLKIKMVFAVLGIKPNWISSMPAHCLIYFSMILSAIFRI